MSTMTVAVPPIGADIVEYEVVTPTYEVVMVVVGIGTRTRIVSVLSVDGLNGSVVTPVVVAVTVLVVYTTTAPLESAKLFLYGAQLIVFVTELDLLPLQVYLKL